MPEVLSLTRATIEPLWRDVSFTLAAGDFLCVLGPNGVGKSTLLSAIIGTRSLHAGQVRAPDRLGYIPQLSPFDPDVPLRAKDLVSLAAAHGMRPAPKGKVAELLAEVGAAGLANHRVGTLSGGQQQLIRQAQALACDPELLLCDEPLNNLDPAMQQRMVNLIARRRQQHNTAIVFVTHSINPVAHLCDTVLYLGPKGYVIGPLQEVMTSQSLSALYGAPVHVVEVDGRLVVVT